LADVERELTLGGQMALDSDAIVRPDISEREELTYRIVEIKADFSIFKKGNANVVKTSMWGLRDCVAEAKRKFLIGLLGNTPNDIESINNVSNGELKIDHFNADSFYNANNLGMFSNAGIIFCPYRAGTLGVLDKIKNQKIIKTGISTYVASLDANYKVGTYLGGANPTMMKPFLENQQNIMVATKAFGMGIDKSNVRFTINLTHPSSIESYVQEAGRGGRDKKIALSYLLYEPTELIDLSVENLADTFGANIPAPFNWLGLYQDQYVERSDLKNLCIQYGLLDTQIQQLEDYLSKYTVNVDKDIQLYFHNNSFKGSYKERVILVELAYGVINAPNLPQNNDLGIYAVMNGLNIGDYSFVEVHGENQLMESYQQFHDLIINEANSIAAVQGWEQIPNTVLSNGELDEKNVPTFGALLKEISKATGNLYWRQYHNAGFMKPLEKAFCRRRDTDDTDKAIYRMCCIGLVDDVKIEYLDNDKHKYTLRVVKRQNNGYYDCLLSFFEKYYSTAQSHMLVNNARNYGAQTEIDNCLGYLTHFVYEKLEEKRRLSIKDMRDACVGGITRGDVWLKDFIHLYFNSKYAKDYHEVSRKNYSLRQDIRQPNIDLIMKYINVISIDPTGPVVTNVKHLYGAVLIILRDQLTDEIASSILYLLRSYCLAFLGVGENPTLIDEFKASYWENGWRRFINANGGNNPQNLITLFGEYNQAILKDAKDGAVIQYIEDKREEIILSVVAISYNKFSIEYLN